MNLQILSIYAIASLISFTSCHNNPATITTKSGWRFPVLRQTSEKRIGRQMPPHPEPDAILINVGEDGKPVKPGGFPRLPGGPDIFGMPGGPQDPGVFGFPRSRGGSGINSRPGVFGVPLGPGVFGIPRLPSFPNTFGIPGFHTISRNQGEFGGIPSGSGVFISPQGQRSLLPTAPSRVGQNGHQFTVRTGVFGIHGGPFQPGEQSMFGHRGVFLAAGSGNYPYSGAPGLFFPGRRANVPEATEGFPVTRERVPDTFIPRSGGILPGVYYPEAPIVPNQPGDTDGRLPRKKLYGGSGEREIYNDPIADLFPLIDATPSFFQSS